MLVLQYHVAACPYQQQLIIDCYMPVHLNDISWSEWTDARAC